MRNDCWHAIDFPAEAHDIGQLICLLLIISGLSRSLDKPEFIHTIHIGYSMHDN